MISISCKNCGKNFDTYPSLVCKRKTCSKSCAAKLKTGLKNPFFGKKHSDRTKSKLSQVKMGLRGNKTNRWLGTQAKYRAIHMWVDKMLGKPDTCESCGTKNLHGHKINWANKSGKYKRILSDWLRLCVKCHRNFDLQMGVHHSI